MPLLISVQVIDLREEISCHWSSPCSIGGVELKSAERVKPSVGSFEFRLRDNRGQKGYDLMSVKTIDNGLRTHFREAFLF